MTTYGAVVTRPIVGGVYEAGDGSLYAYSGMVNFDGTTSATYQMLRFNLLKEARFIMTFDVAWVVLQSSGHGCGITVDIAGNECISWTTIGGTGGDVGNESNPREFYVPANAEVIINLLNPSGSSSLLRANITLNGNYIEPSSTGEQVGNTTVPPGLRNLPRDGKRRASNFDLIGAVAEGW